MSADDEGAPTTVEEQKPDLPPDELEEGPLRYLGFAARVGRVLSPYARYTAYSSDFGEAFRPVVHRRVVHAAYGLTYAYCISDVALQTYRAHKAGFPRNEVYRTLVYTTTFQGLASVLLPAIAVHQTVHLSAHLFKRAKSPRIARFGPTAAGLALIPFLPTLLDHPAEHVINLVFQKVWPSEHHHHHHHAEQQEQDKKTQ
ncbi:Mitochondrial fission process protein 1 [Balamuthia mandrillaris]